jgi:hypothetical protein
MTSLREKLVRAYNAGFWDGNQLDQGCRAEDHGRADEVASNIEEEGE